MSLLGLDSEGWLDIRDKSCLRLLSDRPDMASSMLGELESPDDVTGDAASDTESNQFVLVPKAVYRRLYGLIAHSQRLEEAAGRDGNGDEDPVTTKTEFFVDLQKHLQQRILLTVPPRKKQAANRLLLAMLQCKYLRFENVYGVVVKLSTKYRLTDLPDVVQEAFDRHDLEYSDFSANVTDLLLELMKPPAFNRNGNKGGGGGGGAGGFLWKPRKRRKISSEQRLLYVHAKIVVKLLLLSHCPISYITNSRYHS